MVMLWYNTNMSEHSLPLNPQETAVLFPAFEDLPNSLPAPEYDPVAAHDAINIGVRPAYTPYAISRRLLAEVQRTGSKEVADVGTGVLKRILGSSAAEASYTHTPLPGVQPDVQLAARKHDPEPLPTFDIPA